MGQIWNGRTNGRLLLPASWIVPLALTVATPAAAQPAEVYGGSDGRYFEFGCGPGQILVGLRASAGILIDNAQAICARVNSSGGFASAAPQGPVFGSSRPQDQHVECPQGFGVAGARIGKNEHYPHVGAIELTCRELVNRAEGGTAHVQVRGSGNLEGHNVTIGVGDNPGGSMPGYSICANNYATGIRGRAGDYLSAFGLLCGQAVSVAEPGPAKTLNKRKKSSIAGKYPGAASATTSIPQAQKTLNKRKKPGSWPPPQEQAGNMGASLNSDGGIGIPAPAPVSTPPAPVASSLIGGIYATIVSITDSRCMIQEDMRGSWEGAVDVTPRPGVLIPLEQFSGFFGGPVILNVDGLRLSQSTKIPMKFGPLTAPAPARFEGAFSEDGSSFEVQFQAGTDFCRVGGTIQGSRN